MTFKKEFVYYTGFKSEAEADEIHDKLVDLSKKEFDDAIPEMFDYISEVNKNNSFKRADRTDQDAGKYNYILSISIITIDDKKEGIINQFLVQKIPL